ncbi:MAG: DUF4910 domain-containing protein [Alphaproteobacteria bacterium]|nr:DUF4910 domain-containing protein [Alphaproteobacteria bacterium]
MWSLIEELFPLYRALCGSGFHDSLLRIAERLPLNIEEFPTGEEVLGWTIPEEFEPRAAWVDGPDGRRVLDFAQESYHMLLYSQPFEGEVDLDELLEHIETHTHLDDAVPLRHTYYRDRWGMCASQKQVAALKSGRYRVHIDTELRKGFLRIGECYLPGETDQEILINTYLCHPKGANDNLSSVVVAVELFRMLAAMPRRRYSYRLALWPESIGAITYIAKHPERLARTIGGYSLMMVGDAAPLAFTGTYRGGSLFERAASHSLRHNGWSDKPLPYSRWKGGSDAMIFDNAGLRLPFCTWQRGGPELSVYPAYHSSKDDLTLVRPEYLYETLTGIWDALMAVERAVVYKAKYVVDPFLTKRGIFPFQHGAGGGKHGNENARAYFEVMGSLDGTQDLLEVADRYNMPIRLFDEPIQKLLEADLIGRVDTE